MKKINCPECGTAKKKNENYCSHCGHKFNDELDNKEQNEKTKEETEQKQEKEKNKTAKEEAEQKQEKEKNKTTKIIIITIISALIIITGIFVLAVKVFDVSLPWEEETTEPQSNDRDETVDQIEVIISSINIREEASISSDKLGKVYIGEIYTVLDKIEKNGDVWYHIRTKNNIDGYIAGIYNSDDYIKELNAPKVEENKPVEEKPVENTQTNPAPTKPSTSSKPKPSTSSKPKPSTNNNQTNQNTNQNQNNNTQSTENYEPKLPACLKTCDEGYVLKDENSVNCYCEKIVVEKTPKEKLVDYLKEQGFNCSTIQCENVVTQSNGWSSTTEAINFSRKTITRLTWNQLGDVSKVEYYYSTDSFNSMQESYDFGKVTARCTNFGSNYNCSPSWNNAVSKTSEMIRIFNRYFDASGVTLEEIFS